MSTHVTLIALVDVEVCLGIPLCVTRRVPRGSRGLILGSTGRGAPHSLEHWKGAPLFVSRQCFPNKTCFIPPPSSIVFFFLDLLFSLTSSNIEYQKRFLFIASFNLSSISFLLSCVGWHLSLSSYLTHAIDCLSSGAGPSEPETAAASRKILVDDSILVCTSTDTGGLDSSSEKPWMHCSYSIIDLPSTKSRDQFNQKSRYFEQFTKFG